MCEHQYNSLTEYFLAHRRVSRHAQVCFVNPNPVVSNDTKNVVVGPKLTKTNYGLPFNDDLMSFFQGYVVLFVYSVIKYRILPQVF